MTDSNFYIDESTGEKKPMAGYPVLFELNQQNQFKTLRKSLKVSRPVELSAVEKGTGAGAPVQEPRGPPPDPPVAPINVEPAEAVIVQEVFQESPRDETVFESNRVVVPPGSTPEDQTEDTVLIHRQVAAPRVGVGGNADRVVAAPVVREVKEEPIREYQAWASWAHHVYDVLHADKVIQAVSCVTAVIYMDNRMTCRDALANFSRLGISGAPIKDVGVVELFDILALVVNQPKPSIMQRYADPNRNTWLDNVLDLPVVVAVCAASRYRRDEVTKAIRVSQAVSVAQAVELLSQFWRFIIPSTVAGSPTHLVSQVTLMRYLAAKLPHLPNSFKNKCASETSAVTRKILYVEESTEIDMVFASMVHHKVHVVAVCRVSGSGQRTLKGEISISQLEGYMSMTASDFSLSVGDFLKKARGGDWKPDKVLTCNANATIAQVIQNFASHEGAHHIWVTAGLSKKMIGVITITSLFQSMCGLN